jgi:tetratricopeptide (TPR) repeat protein
MPNAAAPPVYFFLWLPKTAGTTLYEHLRSHMPPERLMDPALPSALRLLSRHRYHIARMPDLAPIRAVTGHWMGHSLERLFPGREIRRTILLRDPIGFHISLYNFRMMRAAASGHRSLSFDRHLRQMPRDHLALFLLGFWLETPITTFLRTSDERKYELVNEALADFWFVGSHHDCDRLIATVADDLEVPPVATAKNTSTFWEQRFDWQPLRADDLTADMRAAILARNPIHDALWQSWHEAGFDAARLRPKPLSRERRGRIGFGTLLGSVIYHHRVGIRELNAEYVWEPADRAAQARDWPRAVALYAKALQHVPRFPGIWVQYGHCLKESGDIAAAENAYRQATELDPSVGEVYLHLAHVLTLRHRDREAAVAYRCFAQLDPARWQQWCDELVAAGHSPEAVASYWVSLIGADDCGAAVETAATPATAGVAHAHSAIR